MEAINNHPDVFDEQHEDPEKSHVKLLGRAHYDDGDKNATEEEMLAGVRGDDGIENGSLSKKGKTNRFQKDPDNTNISYNHDDLDGTKETARNF